MSRVVRWPDRPRALVSYWYAKGWTQAQITAEGPLDLVIDSGAFSAHSTGERVDRDEFTAWLAARPAVTRAFALDVIGNPDESWANWRAQHAELSRSRPDLTLLPTWHVGSPLSKLEEMCAAADYVAIGGMVAHSSRRQVLMRTCIQAHKIARRHGTSLHGLGVTGSTLLQLPWRSVDSSSWTIPRRRPIVYLADQHGKMHSITRGEPITRQRAAVIRAYGLDPVEFRTYGSTVASKVGKSVAKARTTAAVAASIRSYQFVDAVNTHRSSVYLACTPRDISSDIVPALRMGPPYRRP